MLTLRDRITFGGLVLLVGGAVGALIDRYVFPRPEPVPLVPAPPAPKPDFDQLAGKWTYPSAQVVSAGRTGAVQYYQIATTTDDLARVAAFYKRLVGRDIVVASGGGGSEAGADSISATESWSAGEPNPSRLAEGTSQPRAFALGARAEAGFSATLVLYRGKEDGLTHIALTIMDRAP
jgi:hypothetical protein